MSTELVPFTETGEPASDGRSVNLPRMSSTGFPKLLERLATEGLPQIFDRSFFREYSGSLIAHIRGTLRFFELIDEDRRPTDQLRALVSMDEERRIASLRKLVEEKYAFVTALGPDATHGQLTDVFVLPGCRETVLQRRSPFI